MSVISQYFRRLLIAGKYHYTEYVLHDTTQCIFFQNQHTKWVILQYITFCEFSSTKNSTYVDIKPSLLLKFDDHLNLELSIFSTSVQLCVGTLNQHSRTAHVTAVTITAPTHTSSCAPWSSCSTAHRDMKLIKLPIPVRTMTAREDQCLDQNRVVVGCGRYEAIGTVSSILLTKQRIYIRFWTLHIVQVLQ